MPTVKGSGRSVTEGREAVAALGLALRRHAHTLAERPDLTWQQLYTEWVAGLEGVDHLFEAEERRRSGRREAPWLAARLVPMAVPGLVRTLGVDDLPMLRCAASRDNTTAIAGGARGELVVWRIDSGRRLRTIGPHPAPITACAISADTRYAATGCEDGSVRVWHLWSGRLGVVFTGHADRVLDCTFSPDGFVLYTTARDGAAARWDLVDQKPIEFQEPMAELGNVTAHALSPDAWTIGTAFEDGLVLAGSLRTGAVRSLQLGGKVEALAFSPDGRKLACAETGIVVWDILGGPSPRVGDGLTRTCAFTPDGRRVVAGDAWGTVTIHDVETSEHLGTFDAHARQTNSCSVTPDGTAALSCGDDGAVRLWRLDRVPRVRHDLPRSPLRDCAFSPDGDRLYLATPNIEEWDPFEGVRRRLLDPDGRRLGWTSVAATRRIVVAGSPAQGGVWIWDPDTGAVRHFLEIDHGWGWVAVSAAGGTVASCGVDGSVGVWREDGARFAHRIEGDAGPLHAIALSPDGRFVFTGAEDGHLRRWDGDALVWALGVHDGAVRSIALDAARDRLATGGDDSVARLWAMPGFGLLQTFTGHSDAVTRCALSPGGDFLATSSRDDSVRVWSTASGQELLRAPLGGDALCVSFHPRVPLIACGDRAGGLYVFDLVGLRRACAPL
jgi:WD40 repeat protein